MHFGKTVRGRLLPRLAGEAVMLALLIGNSVRLLYDSLSDQAKRHARQMSPILNAALMAPLAQRDHTVRAILDETEARTVFCIWPSVIRAASQGLQRLAGRSIHRLNPMRPSPG